MIKIYNGDCLKIMDNLIAEGVKVDLILVDLPYGVTQLEWDAVIPFDKMWEKINSLKKENSAVLMFGQGKFSMMLGMSNINAYKYSLIWEKTQATGHLTANKMPMKAHEDILVFYDKPPVYNAQKTQGHKPVNSYKKTIKNQNNTKLYNLQSKEIVGGGNTDRFPRSVLKFRGVKRTERFHTTEKPVELLEWLIKSYSNECCTVLDFTMGSGSTGVACKKLNRKFIGIELDKKYFEIAKERIGNDGN